MGEAQHIQKKTLWASRIPYPAMQPDTVFSESGRRDWSSVGEQEKLSGRCKWPDGLKTNSSWPRLPPRHSTMHLLGPLLLLLGKDGGLGRYLGLGWLWELEEEEERWGQRRVNVGQGGDSQCICVCVCIRLSLCICLPSTTTPPLQRKFFRMLSLSFSNAFCSLWWVPEYLAFSDSAQWTFEHPKIDLFFHPLTCFLIKLFVLILGLQKCCKDNSKSFLPYTQFPPML